MQGHVQALFDFLRVGHEPHEATDDLDEPKANDKGVHGCERCSCQLLGELLRTCLNAIDLWIGQDANEECTKIASHAMHAPHVQSIVQAQAISQLDAAIAEGC